MGGGGVIACGGNFRGSLFRRNKVWTGSHKIAHKVYTTVKAVPTTNKRAFECQAPPIAAPLCGGL